VNARISDQIATVIKGDGWLDSDGYLWRHLASHASVGRILDKRVTDPGYPAVADPIRLRPALTTLADDTARKIADIYWRIIYELPPAETVRKSGVNPFGRVPGSAGTGSQLELTPPSAWRCRWANWISSASNRILGRHLDSFNAVELGLVAASR
jgi:hypothetical protein